MDVAITITKAIVNINFLCSEFICKQRANEITPLIKPEYQHIFNYLEVRINGLPIIL